MYFILLNVESAKRVQVSRVASEKGPLLTNQDVFIGFSRHVNHWTDIVPHSDLANPE